MELDYSEIIVYLKYLPHMDMEKVLNTIHLFTFKVLQQAYNIREYVRELELL